ncbi:hypothetical protein AGIG_G17093 [Arapaima gigas]
MCAQLPEAYGTRSPISFLREPRNSLKIPPKKRRRFPISLGPSSHGIPFTLIPGQHLFLTCPCFKNDQNIHYTILKIFLSHYVPVRA